MFIKRISLIFMMVAISYLFYNPAFSQLALHVEPPKTVLFGTDTINTGNKLMWIASKGAFRAGFALLDYWSYDSIGSYSASLGLGNKALGWSSTAMGSTTTASASVSTAMGANTMASGWGSTAMGLNTISNGFASLVLGMFNDEIVGAQDTATTTTPLFIIGNGTSDTTRSNALVVRRNGKIGLGTNNPTSRLHIKANSVLGVGALAHLLLEESEADFSRLRMQNTTANRFWDIAGLPHATDASAMLNFYYNNTGNILSLKGDGNATLLGTLTENSDARLKTKILPLTTMSSQLLKLQGYTYRWKNPALDPSEKIGLLAQEVEQYFPQLVREDENGMKSVHYSGFVPLLIEQLKKQSRELKEKEATIASLLSEVNQLKEKAERNATHVNRLREKEIKMEAKMKTFETRLHELAKQKE
jgi:hypothetical protein